MIFTPQFHGKCDKGDKKQGISLVRPKLYMLNNRPIIRNNNNINIVLHMHVQFITCTIVKSYIIASYCIKRSTHNYVELNIALQWNPSKPSPLKVSLLEGWPHFRGEFVLESMLWDFSKWPEYRGGHISGVLIRGVPL